MTAITCAKCNRRFTPTIEEIRAYLAVSQGQRHARVQCPHCGKETKVAPERLQEAVRFAPPPAAEETTAASVENAASESA
jgi:DNA-directed RNA polymerase subunit RPC12/RpoP